jgi:hypothetical protein
LALGTGLALFGIAALVLVAVLPATLALLLAWRRHHSAPLVLLTAYVILAGAELNAEIERQTTRAGAPCSVDPQPQ